MCKRTGGQTVTLFPGIFDFAFGRAFFGIRSQVRLGILYSSASRI